MQPIAQVAVFDPELGDQDVDQSVDAVLEDLGGGHHLGFALRVDEHQVGRDRQLAVGEGVESVD